MLIIPVADVEILYRRVPYVEGLYVIQADGTVKVSSAVFSDRFFRPSVNRAELCYNDPRKTQHGLSDGMPYRMLCNGTEQKSLEARSGLTLKPSHFSPLHNIRYGVVVTHDVRSIDTVVQNNKAGKIIQTFDVDIEHVPILNDPTLPDNPAHAEIYTNPHCPNKSVFRKLAERLSQLANERPWEIEMSNLSM